MKRTSTHKLLPGLALGVCMGAQAATPQAPATTECHDSNMKVGIDAKTGKLRPLTAVESRQLDQMRTQGRQPTLAPAVAKSFHAPADAAAARATVRRHAHGGVSVKLPEDQMSEAAVLRDIPGPVCVEHSGDAPQVEGLPEE